MRKLVEGVRSFQESIFTAEKEFFAQLAAGQEPSAVFITCSDSRIDPNLITQTRPGDLFVLRNAGNIVPPQGMPGGEAASIEYAVEALGIEDIIVCGHSHCGAMKGLLHPDKLGNMTEVAAWLRHAEPVRRLVQERSPHLAGEKLLEACVEQNVLVQLDHLRTHRCVRAALARGKLRLHGWVYRIESGDVFAHDPARAKFVRLGEAATA